MNCRASFSHLLVFCLLISTKLNAQTEITLSTAKENEKILVAHNGFLVYPLPKRVLAIELIAGDNLIQVLRLPDSILAEKMIKLPEGKHKYIVNTDRSGNLKLWYRGAYKQRADSVVLYKAKSEFPVVWVQPNKPSKVLTLHEERKDTLLAIKADKEQISAEKKLDSNLVALLGETNNELIESSAADAKSDSIKPEKSKSLEIKVIEKVEKITPREASSDEIIQILAAKEFEFDKLSTAMEYVRNHPADAERAREICKILKYDLTRIQFLKVAYQSATNVENFDTLEDVFDFEASRQQFLEFVKSNPK